MLFPERMVEITVLTVDDFLKPISDYLIKFGEFEVKTVTDKNASKLLKLKPKDNNENEKFSNLKTRLDKLSLAMKIDENKIKLTIEEREPLSIEDIERRLSKIENDFYTVTSAIEKIEKEALELRIKKLNHQITKELSFKNIPKEFFVTVIVVTKYDAGPIIKNLSSLPSIIEEIETFGDLSIILVALPQGYKSEIIKLSTSFIKFIDIANVITEDVNIKDIEEKLKDIELEKKKLTSTLDKIIETHTEEILTLYKGLWFVNSSMRIKNASIKGGKFIIFSGWIPEKHSKTVVEELKRITNDISVIELKNAKNLIKEDKNTIIPTKLNNPKMLRSFESLVKLYAIPRFYEIDPTVIFAVLYVIFYGMMFGDVGQGLVLSVVSALLFWKFKSFRVVAGLGIAVGLSAALFGFLYGSVFGVEEKIIPAMWTSPLHDVLKLMKVSILIGFIVIFIGLLFNIVNTVIEHNLPKLLLGSKGIPGLVFYTFLIGYPIYALVFGSSLNTNLMALGILIPLLMFVIESIIEAKKHNHDISPVAIFFELFEVFISFVSNTISFIRIAGFALNHTALMITFFSIAEVVKGGFIGDIIALFIIVFGQIFIIGFEGLIVGIQALRLSFYEFFTKFFRGGGKAFDPLK
ncbi:MAG: hypothetical protein N2712_04220 [Brevinematales bacterium]|nr:hypothetical protein [Brevinematales bacterium]